MSDIETYYEFELQFIRKLAEDNHWEGDPIDWYEYQRATNFPTLLDKELKLIHKLGCGGIQFDKHEWVIPTYTPTQEHVKCECVDKLHDSKKHLGLFAECVNRLRKHKENNPTYSHEYILENPSPEEIKYFKDIRERFNAFKHWYGTAYSQAQIKPSTTASLSDIRQEEK